MRLYGVAEIAEALGITRQAVANHLSRGTMPQPDARLAMGPVWMAETIEPWIEGRKATLDWEHEENPGWDGTGTIAESWYTQHGEYTARIDRFHDDEGGYAYTVEYMGNPVPGGENVDAESFEAAEAAVLRLID